MSLISQTIDQPLSQLSCSEAAVVCRMNYASAVIINQFTVKWLSDLQTNYVVYCYPFHGFRCLWVLCFVCVSVCVGFVWWQANQIAVIVFTQLREHVRSNWCLD